MEETYMLKGLNVLDFGKHVAAPAIGGLMAEYGANVIHIERPEVGDDSRYYPPTVEGYGSFYIWLNRGKKSVTMDLKNPEMKETVINIIKDTDVLVESFRPGVMKKLGLDYETVKKIKPDIIYCSISAFGQTGPYSKRPGYDIIGQAASGIMNATGEKEGPPTKMGFTIGDTTAAMNGFGCIMMALYHRAMTGEGQHVDISLARSLMWHNMVIRKSLNGISRSRYGNHDSMLCPYGIFQGKNNDYIVIGVADTVVWKRLCNAMDRKDLGEDPKYSTNVLRYERQKEVNKLVTDWLCSKETIEDAEKILLDNSVPCFKVYGDDEILADEHIRVANWLVELDLPEGAENNEDYHIMGMNGIAGFSKGKVRNLRAPDLGADNEEIFEKYGMKKEEK